MTKLIAIVLTAFFARVNPVSTSANPACMNMTRKAATRTQATLSDASMGDVILSRRRADGGWVRGRGPGAVAEPDQRGQRRQHRRDHQRRPQPARDERAV